MVFESRTLLDKLVSLVTIDHADEVKKIISKLTTIDNYKYTIDNNSSLDDLYKKIAYELQTEFRIFNFSIVLITNSIENDLYEFGDNKMYNFVFEHKLDENVFINIRLLNDDINEFTIISLNSYFDSFVDLLYLKYILMDTQSTTIDPLTKLSNRMSFQQEMKTLIPLALREKMTIGVLVINIDRFRAVNDEHGDEFGDEFLKLYAKTIKDTIRESDLAVRFGGGEFLVLLINVDSEERIEDIANNIKDKLASTYLLSPNGDKFKKTVCIGISSFPQDSIDINEVVKKAEIALIDAKDLGRNKILKYIQEEESVIDFF